jgi:hypothetical protein
METALQQPCYRGETTTSSTDGTGVEEDPAWAAVPEGCYGTVVGSGGVAPSETGPHKLDGVLLMMMMRKRN